MTLITSQCISANQDQYANKSRAAPSPWCVLNLPVKLCDRIKVLLIFKDAGTLRTRLYIFISHADVLSVSDQVFVDMAAVGASDRKSGRASGRGRAGRTPARGQRSRRIGPAAGQPAHQGLPTSEPPSASCQQAVLRHPGGRGQSCFPQTSHLFLISFHIIMSWFII